MTDKYFTIAFFDFHTGRRYGVEHFRRYAGGDVYDHIESRAEDFANATGAEIDVRSAVKNERGEVVGFVREGLRVRCAA